MRDISSKIIKNLNESLSLFGHASLIVCGGSSPINVFKDLSKSEIDSIRALKANYELIIKRKYYNWLIKDLGFVSETKDTIKKMLGRYNP